MTSWYAVLDFDFLFWNGRHSRPEQRFLVSYIIYYSITTTL
jgi:hypothetical protein